VAQPIQGEIMRSILALAILLLTVPVLAKDLSVATVDLQKLFKAYPETQKAEARLDALAEKKKKDLMESTQELQDLKKELESSSSLLAAKTKERKEKEFKEKAQKLDLLHQQIQGELQAKNTEMVAQILKEIKELAAAEAKQRGIDLVLDSEKTVYVNGGLDLTADLLKKFEKMAADSKPEAAPKKK